MSPQKVLSVIEKYEQRLVSEGVKPQRIDIDRTFGSLSVAENLSHAHYLIKNLKTFAHDFDRIRKIGSHLAAIQMCLSNAHWLTLRNMMDDTRPDGTPFNPDS